MENEHISDRFPAWPISDVQWHLRPPFIMRSVVFEPAINHLDNDKIREPIKYHSAFNQEELLYLIKWCLASDTNKRGEDCPKKKGAESLPTWLANKVGYGERLVILDGLSGAGKSKLCRELQELHRHVDKHHLTPRLYVFDDTSFGSIQGIKGKKNSRTYLTRVQCQLLRAWERRSPEVLDALHKGGKVLVVRGPQGYALFDDPLIPRYARKVLVARINKLVGAWMEAQGLVGYNPPRVCIDIPGTFVEKEMRLKAGLGDVYMEPQLSNIKTRMFFMNLEEASLSPVNMASGLCLKWHTAFAELSEWALSRNTRTNPASPLIWVQTSLCLVTWEMPP